MALFVADFQLNGRLKITCSYSSMKKAEGVLKLHVSPWVGRESITGFILYNEHYRTVYSLYSMLEWIPYEVGTYVISCNRSTLTTKVRGVSWRFRTYTRFKYDTKMVNIKVGNK